MATVLQCPVCRELLLNSADGYKCSKNHTFDAAREGYVNLLLAHQKHSKEPGDSTEMVLSRRRFLNLGFYDKVSDGINEIAARALTQPGSADIRCILDAGCGEGFYLKRLKDSLECITENPLPINYYGLDISKFAVRQATHRDRTVDWFVASIADLPFLPSSFDIVLNIFSPANFAEFSRVLKEPGRLVIVSPGPRHLNGLKEIIYPVAREHSQAAMIEQAKKLFSFVTETRITYQLELESSDAIRDLLAMTPYFWNINLQTKSKVDALTRLALDVDVEIRVFEKVRS